MGVGPTSPGWKPGIIAVIRHPHIYQANELFLLCTSYLPNREVVEKAKPPTFEAFIAYFSSSILGLVFSRAATKMVPDDGLEPPTSCL